MNFFAHHYEHPGDIDVLFSGLDQRAYPGAHMPKLVSQSTCLEFKRLKCTDRFFYKWNPNLGEGAIELLSCDSLHSLIFLNSFYRGYASDRDSRLYCTACTVHRCG